MPFLLVHTSIRLIWSKLCGIQNVQIVWRIKYSVGGYLQSYENIVYITPTMWEKGKHFVDLYDIFYVKKLKLLFLNISLESSNCCNRQFWKRWCNDPLDQDALHLMIKFQENDWRFHYRTQCILVNHPFNTIFSVIVYYDVLMLKL